MNIIPMCAYSSPIRSANMRIFGREDETTNMSVLIGHVRAVFSGITYLYEARMLWEYWHNFCGGLKFFSPQVNAMSLGSGGRILGHEDSSFIPFINDVFPEGVFTHPTNVEKVMWESLAAGWVSNCIDTSKRFSVGADRRSGLLNRFISYLKTVNNQSIYNSCFHFPGGWIGRGRPRNDTDFATNQTLWQQQIRSPDYSNSIGVQVSSASAQNWNSSSTCDMSTVILNHNTEGRPKYHTSGANPEHTRLINLYTPVINDYRYTYLLPNFKWGN